jgi:hypothetical protein
MDGYVGTCSPEGPIDGGKYGGVLMGSYAPMLAVFRAGAVLMATGPNCV